MRSTGLALGFYAAVMSLSAVLVLAMIRVAILDTPGHRSAHARPTPKGGGVGVVVAFLIGVPTACLLSGFTLGFRGLSLLCAVGLLSLVSWLDDVRQFRPAVKLAAQALAAILVLAGLGPLPVPWIAGLIIGFGWLLFVTNALNFIDGLNGLASGSMALACLFIGATAPPGMEQTAAYVLAAGLAGFLPFNYPKAAIFLGDVGSQGAGLAVAALGLWRWQDPAPWPELVMPMLLSGILYDVAFTLCRRLIAGQRLSEAHRGHLYQVAFRSGMPAWAIALLHWGFVAWSATATRLLPHAAPWALGLVLLPQLVWTGIVVRRASRRPIGKW